MNTTSKHHIETFFRRRKNNVEMASKPHLVLWLCNYDVLSRHVTDPYASPGHICCCDYMCISLQWRHNDRNGVSNHHPHDCLLNILFRQRWKKTSKLRVTGLREGHSLETGEFPAQRASNAENVSIWWRHHVQSSYVSPSSDQIYS